MCAEASPLRAPPCDPARPRRRQWCSSCSTARRWPSMTWPSSCSPLFEEFLSRRDDRKRSSAQPSATPSLRRSPRRRRDTSHLHAHPKAGERRPARQMTRSRRQRPQASIDVSFDDAHAMVKRMFGDTARPRASTSRVNSINWRADGPGCITSPLAAVALRTVGRFIVRPSTSGRLRRLSGEMVAIDQRSSTTSRHPPSRARHGEYSAVTVTPDRCAVDDIQVSRTRAAAVRSGGPTGRRWQRIARVRIDQCMLLTNALAKARRLITAPGRRQPDVAAIACSARNAAR